MFQEAIENILADQSTPATIRAVEQGTSARTLWDTLAESGFLELMAPQSAGGAELALDAIFPIFVAFGRHAVPAPVAQTIAARVLWPLAAGSTHIITLAGHGRREIDGSVVATHVASGLMADEVLLGLDGVLWRLDAARAERLATGVHGSLLATLRWPQDAVPGPVSDNGDEVAVFGAAIHAAAIAGAMERLFAMTLEYCNDRAQFGKPIGKFQTIQHQLSVMAEHVACAGIAAELAFPAGVRVPTRLAAATAKARTSMAVPLVTATAHALHGAIGVTEEYNLQLYSRRLHEWRMADGSEAYWNRIVGTALLAQPAVSVLDFVKEQVL